MSLPTLWARQNPNIWFSNPGHHPKSCAEMSIKYIAKSTSARYESRYRAGKGSIMNRRHLIFEKA